MARNQNTFAKMQREMNKKRKAEEKRQRRLQRKAEAEEVAAEPTDTEDQNTEE